MATPDSEKFHTPDPEADRLAELEEQARKLGEKIDKFEKEAVPPPLEGDQPGSAV